MRNYELIVNGVVYDIRGDALPTGTFNGSVSIYLRTVKKASVAPGPNFDGTWNSIQAALIYEPVRANIRHEILKYMLKRNTVWLEGRTDLVGVFGTDALTRVRELRRVYGWPIEEKSRKKGAWWYRMNYTVTPPPRRIVRNP